VNPPYQLLNAQDRTLWRTQFGRGLDLSRDRQILDLIPPIFTITFTSESLVIFMKLTAMLLSYILQERCFYTVEYCSKICYHTSFLDLYLSGASVAPNSYVRGFSILSLLIVGNVQVETSVVCNNIRSIKFRESQ
jgi:hypothetical protein